MNSTGVTVISLFWSGFLAVLAWGPLQVVRALRAWQLGRRGMVAMELGVTTSRGAPSGAEAQVDLLRDLARDVAVRGVILNIRGLRTGWATTQDLRAALQGLRRAGKLVVMHLDDVGSRELFIASAADRVWLPPSAELLLGSVSARMVFFGDALDLLGLHAEVVAAGRYKSFGEPFSRAWATAANREQVSSLVHDLQVQLVDGIAQGRGVDPSVVLDIMGRSPVPAQDLVDAGLIDGLAYVDQARQQVEELLGSKLRAVSSGLYAWWLWIENTLARAGAARPGLAVLHLEGAVVSGGPDRSGARQRVDADRVVPALDKLREDDEVRGVVLHVNSPGGSALASDIIARAVSRLSEKKPVVAAFGDVSASGGYYIAAPAQEVIARPGSITGSIGVIAGKLVMGPAVARLGVHSEVVRSGPDSGLVDSWQAFTPPQRAALQGLVDRSYERFLQVVSAGRRMPVQAVDAVGAGRVWTGRQALDNGLVDHLGDLQTALFRLRSLTGLTDPAQPVAHVRFVPPRWRLIRSLLHRDEVTLLDLFGAHLGGPTLRALRLLREAPGQALAVLPWDLEP